MGLLIAKEKGVMSFTGIAKLAITGFIVAMASSFIDTIWALYLNSFVNSAALVGFISAFLAAVSFISYFVFIPLIQKVNKPKLYVFCLVMFAIGYLLFALNNNFYIFIIIASFLTILSTLKVASFGIIVKDKTQKQKLSRNEGLMYTFFNLAWVLGPLIAGYISDAFGIDLIFTLAAIFLLVATAFFMIVQVKDNRVDKKIEKHLLKNFFEFFKDKKRVLVYIISGGINLWWGFIYLFIPLYIIENGLETIWIGYFLFAVAVPLVFLEYPFSKITSKIGFKKMFILGFSITGIFSLICFFFSNLYLILGLLVLASCGMAMLEPTTEAYFFDLTRDDQEQRFYGPYNTGIDLSQFIGKILASILLIFLPFKFLFILFASMMGIYAVLCLMLKDIVEQKKR
ncbi:MFS transporter [Candidatus Pacearchaeota archaeon]|jgi:MFS family permease|nr:MFS transporter [Candidatus Pacearchaeota archaeon]